MANRSKNPTFSLLRMGNLRALLFFLLLPVHFYSQITIIGHNRLNNEPIKNTLLLVKENGVVTKTISTKASSDFLIKLDFGKNYRIYFQNPKSPVTYLEVLAGNVPEDRYMYKMVHELNIPFFDRNDDDIDTTVFKDPFQRIVFDGNTKMIDDSAYNTSFRSRVLKVHEQPEKRTVRAMPAPATLVGKIVLDNDHRLMVSNKNIVLLNKKGQAIRSTFTNRFGYFVFTGINTSDIGRLKLEVREPDAAANEFVLLNSRHDIIASARVENATRYWELAPASIESLIDNNYTINMGGKLVVSSAKQKRFFANKPVYLCNRFNTVLKKTTTNLFGTFVFEDLKPDNNYYVSVDKFELAPGERVDVLNKDEKFITSLDTVVGGKASTKINSGYNKKFNDLSLNDAEMTMSVKATIYGDNTNNPIGKLKVIMLNDAYQVIDSAITDDFGAFKFKYLPFLKRFYLSAENNENMLDVFKNILIYNKDYNLIKIMTHEKGTRFSYKPVSAEIFRLREVELEDPWLEFMGNKKTNPVKKIIIENILFESGGYIIKPKAREILDKVVVVLQTNKKLKIEIGAHTDSKGSEAENLKLSEQRAKSVLNYITAAGIDPKRVICKGYGESKLLNDCSDEKNCSEEEHARNRRIEFTIIEE